ncbi:class I SAM-dependent methyltransferase [Microvirga mediterraneensis]|uniref:Class I SAM-dependent methyltransferase n=1 Tax=Microvirga mediterraneensis TaxID=2754695 RepID=A0A838BS76_9HYPH|nr:class I SAM-dependent methyltransferase [Microvirga mediterraneensis]MBA1158180.1 class I SAM-dependent methyltransferase [Microvirga mediterraneensis]
MHQFSSPPCRHCGTALKLTFADLGSTPISNDFLSAEQVNGPDPFYPLRAFVCQECRLVQLQDFFRSDDLFREDYAYFSSFSPSWLQHAERYAADMAERFNLTPQSHVVEVASNDGYLLQYFKKRGISVLGVEPSRSVADVAVAERQIPTVVQFFGVDTARALLADGHAADVMSANNVLAHVPDINDFVGGFTVLLKPNGVVTFEFPHLLNLIRLNQFDTIYHEHFSYLSLLAVERILAKNGLRAFDVEELPTHGGSLRVFACRPEAIHAEQSGLSAIRAKEAEAGLDRDEVYLAFGERVRETKRSLLELLIRLKREGKHIVGYGAPAKGNTLLNYCGIGTDMLDFTVDRSPYKQGRFLPGTRLPILDPAAIDQARPDYVLILPWNLKEEITEQLASIRSWGGRFIVPIPVATVLD